MSPALDKYRCTCNSAQYLVYSPPPAPHRPGQVSGGARSKFNRLFQPGSHLFVSGFSDPLEPFSLHCIGKTISVSLGIEW
eukprot:14991206-Heterocapsa_arctica.AAC.1